MTDDGRWTTGPRTTGRRTPWCTSRPRSTGSTSATGYWGRQDVTSDFTIGRNQVVIADVNSHDLVVQQDGVTVATYPASYGKGTNPDTTTRSGIHVVMELFETKLMSNPKYGYVNLEEHWAVRISDNGEFIHANPDTVGDQGNTQRQPRLRQPVGRATPRSTMKSAIYGDPVEVTGTDVQLSADGRRPVTTGPIPWDKWVTHVGQERLTAVAGDPHRQCRPSWPSPAWCSGGAEIEFSSVAGQVSYLGPQRRAAVTPATSTRRPGGDPRPDQRAHPLGDDAAARLLR